MDRSPERGPVSKVLDFPETIHNFLKMLQGR